MASGRLEAPKQVSHPWLLGSAPGGETLGGEISSVSALPHPLSLLMPTASSSRPWAVGQQRAEGLALHTNVLAHCQSPFVPGSSIEAALGQAQWGLCPQVPPNSHLLSEPPPPPPTRPSCPEGPESMGEWAQGQATLPHSLGRLERWAFDRADYGGHRRGQAQLPGQGESVEGAGMQVL